MKNMRQKELIERNYKEILKNIPEIMKCKDNNNCVACRNKNNDFCILARSHTNAVIVKAFKTDVDKTDSYCECFECGKIYENIDEFYKNHKYVFTDYDGCKYYRCKRKQISIFH